MTKTQEAPTTRCIRCGRTLKSARSIAAGMGRTCRAKVAEAAKVIDLSVFKDTKGAATRAEQLIADAGIVPTRHAGQFIATSSDGTKTYTVDTIDRSCTCPAGLKGRACYHLVAADIITASRTAA
jgi:hypothetical protein